MFKQANRLKRDKDIKNVYSRGKSVFDSACGIKFLINTGSTSRFTIVTGIKVHKSAVKRNKVRRQYREIVKKHLEELKPGVDIVFLTSKKALDLDFNEKEQRLMTVFKKAGLL